MGGGDPSSDMKVLDFRSSQFEVNSRRMVVTFILSRYWIGESIANSSKQWCAITNLYGLAQKCQLTTDKYSLSCPNPTQENILCSQSNSNILSHCQFRFPTIVPEIFIKEELINA